MKIIFLRQVVKIFPFIKNPLGQQGGMSQLFLFLRFFNVHEHVVGNLKTLIIPVVNLNS